jgi:hypothetical protein
VVSIAHRFIGFVFRRLIEQKILYNKGARCWVEECDVPLPVSTEINMLDLDMDRESVSHGGLNTK